MPCVRAGRLFAAHPPQPAPRPLGSCPCPSAHQPRRAQHRHHLGNSAQRTPPLRRIRCSRRGKSCRSQDVIDQRSIAECVLARFLSNIRPKAGGDRILNGGWPTNRRARDRHSAPEGKPPHAHHRRSLHGTSAAPGSSMAPDPIRSQDTNDLRLDAARPTSYPRALQELHPAVRCGGETATRSITLSPGNHSGLDAAAP